MPIQKHRCLSFAILLILCVGTLTTGNADGLRPSWAVGWRLINGTVAMESPELVSRVQQELQPPRAAADIETRPGVLLKIPLPVTSATATKVKQSLQRIVETAPALLRPQDRLVVVLEFDTGGGKTGRGSELEACQSLARYLGTPDVKNRVETIAYIPAALASQASGPTQISGHAVLVAIAANQMAMDNDVSIGEAGIDEPNIDELVRNVYRSITAQHLKLAEPLVLAMLDKDQQLFRVRTDNESKFVDAGELDELAKQGVVSEYDTISDKAKALVLTSQQLADFGMLGYRVASRAELAGRLKLAPQSLDSNPAFEGEWRAVQVNLPPFIDERTVQWVRRSLGNQLSGVRPVNLILFDLDSNSGDVDSCLALSRFLVDLDEDSVQTVAHVRGTVRGPVALFALSCDQLIMADDAKLGGQDSDTEENNLSAEALSDLQPMIQALARDQHQDWSLRMAMLDPKLAVVRFRHQETGQLRLLSSEELESLADRDDWEPGLPVDVEDGLTAIAAEQSYVARTIANDAEQVRTFFQLENPPNILAPTPTDKFIEKFASILSRPDVSMLLLFAAMFLMSTEMSVPGIGVPGFLSALCFMLFFWSHYLEGSAHLLEILMFVVGIAFIGIEVFALPGFGIFGVGGLIMVLASLILASQNFILPQNSEQLARLPQSLLPVVGAGLGFFAAIFALRKFIPNSPYLRNFMLAPRQPRLETGLDTDIDPEAIVDWSHLAGKRGDAITRLSPSGKARIDGRVYNVIADGRMIDKGQRVVVIEAIGNRVVVKEA